MEQLAARKIGNRYAKALFEAAVEHGVTSEVSDSIQQLSSVIGTVPEMRAFFETPGIPVAEKQGFIKQNLKPNVAPLVGQLLDLLLENDRLVILPEFTEAYLDLMKQHEGVVDAQITVPVALDNTMQEKIKTKLADLFGYKKVNLTVHHDPAILAGAIIRIGDKIIDGSYKGKLDMLRRQVG